LNLTVASLQTQQPCSADRGSNRRTSQPAQRGASDISGLPNKFHA